MLYSSALLSATSLGCISEVQMPSSAGGRQRYGQAAGPASQQCHVHTLSKLTNAAVSLPSGQGFRSRLFFHVSLPFFLFCQIMWSKTRTHIPHAGPECLPPAAIPGVGLCQECLSWWDAEAHPAGEMIQPTGCTWDRHSSQLDGFLLSEQPALASYTRPPGNFNVPGKSSQKQSHHPDQPNMWPTEQLPKSNPCAFERC